MREHNQASRWRRLAVLTASALLAGTGSVAVMASASSAGPSAAGAGTPNLGTNVIVFTPTEPQTTIQNELDTISTQQVPTSSQFDSNRYAIFFEPGTYGSTSDPLVFEVGYYTEIAGLGAVPQDTAIYGEALVPNTLCSGTGPYPGTDATCNSDDNFWRSLSNLTLNVVVPSNGPVIGAESPDIPEPGFAATFNSAECYENSEMWSASQADPLRSVIVNGSVFFQDYCSPDNYASGGFIANSEITGTLQFDGNQQYFTRNTAIGAAAGCPEGLWNLVFSGVTAVSGGTLPTPAFSGQCQQNTVVPTSPVTEEEPFLYTSNSGTDWQVFLPAVEHNSSGPNFLSGSEAGNSVPISKFFIANPSTPVAQINLALVLGRDLLLTPGVYDLDSPIVVSRPDTVVMGLGFATLVPQNGNAALVALPDKGVKIEDLIVDAGPRNSPVLVSVGTPGARFSAASDPDLLSDIFFRIGGAETTPTSATVSLLDNADNSIIDDLWAWRADHNQDNNTGWTYNRGDTGVVVTGSNVTAYGLAVEHYQKNEVIWSGNAGTDIFFQNELPYDVPAQADWNATPTEEGYPAFDVTNNVTSFDGYGMGSYVVFISNDDVTIYDQQAFEAPTSCSVAFHNVFTVYIAGNGGDNSVIDGVGGPDTSSNPGTAAPQDVPSYPTDC